MTNQKWIPFSIPDTMLDFASVFPDLSSLTPAHVRSAFTYSCLLPHPHDPNGSWVSCSWKSAMTFSHAKQWAHFIFLNKYFIEIQRNKRNLIHEIYVCLNDSQHNLFQLNIYFNIFLGPKTSAHSSVSLCIISPPTDKETLRTALFFPKVEGFPVQLPLKGEPEPWLHCPWHIPQGPASQSLFRPPPYLALNLKPQPGSSPCSDTSLRHRIPRNSL